MKNNNSKIAYLLSRSKALEQWIQNSIVDVGDYFFTFIRLFQVFSNVITNALTQKPATDLETPSGKDINAKKSHGLPPCDDETNGHSRFDRTVHHAHGGLAPAGDAILASMGFSMLLGAIRGIYQKIHATKNISTERLRENLMNTATNENEKQAIAKTMPDTIEWAYQDNDGYNIVSRKTRLSHLHRLKVVRAKPNEIFTDEDLQEAAMQPPPSKQTRLAPINTVSDSPVGRVAGSAWNFGVNQSMIYWLAWYMRVVITNMKESLSLASARITVGVTAAAGFSFSILKLANLVYRFWKKRTTIGHISALLLDPQHTNPRLSATEKANLLKVIAFVRIPDNLKDTGKLNKADLAARKAKINEALTLYQTALANDKVKRKRLRTSWIQTQFMNVEAIQNAQRLGLASQPRAQHLLNDARLDEDIQNPRLRQHLLLENNPLLNRRTVVATIRNVVIGFALPFFIFSMLAAITVFFPHLALAALASGILKSAIITTVAGVVMGAVLGLVTPAAERRNTHHHRANMQAALAEKVIVNDHNITKETKFSLLENRLNTVMAKIRSDSKLLTKIRNSGYAFDRINVYNDDYFEKQRTAPTGWALAKKVMKRAYEFVGGGQTGVLITRFLFLSGMVAAPLLAAVSVATFGAPLIFFGIASVLAVTLGGLRLAHYRQNRAVAHSNECASHLDARIKYLENRTAELEAFVAKNDPKPNLPDHSENLNKLDLVNKDDRDPVVTNTPSSSETTSLTEESLSTETSIQGELKQDQLATVITHEKLAVKPNIVLASNHSTLFGKPSVHFKKPALETRDLPYAARMA